MIFCASLWYGFKVTWVQIILQLIAFVSIIIFPIFIGNEMINMDKNWLNNPDNIWKIAPFYLFFGALTPLSILIRGINGSAYQNRVNEHGVINGVRYMRDNNLKWIIQVMKSLYFLVAVAGTVLVIKYNETGTLMALGATVQDRALDLVDVKLEKKWENIHSERDRNLGILYIDIGLLNTLSKLYDFCSCRKPSGINDAGVEIL